MEFIVVAVAVQASDRLLAVNLAEQLQQFLEDMDVIAEVRLTEGINIEVPDGSDGP